MMEPILDEFAAAVSSTPRSAPRSCRGSRASRETGSPPIRRRRSRVLGAAGAPARAVREGDRAAPRGSDARDPRGRAGTSSSRASPQRPVPGRPTRCRLADAGADGPSSLLAAAGGALDRRRHPRLERAPRATPRGAASRSRPTRSSASASGSIARHATGRDARSTLPADLPLDSERDDDETTAMTQPRPDRQARGSGRPRTGPVRRPVGHGRGQPRRRRHVSRARPRLAVPDPGGAARPEDVRREGLVRRPAGEALHDRRARRPTSTTPSRADALPARPSPAATDAAPATAQPRDLRASAATRRVGRTADRRAARDHAPAAGGRCEAATALSPPRPISAPQPSTPRARR